MMNDTNRPSLREEMDELKSKLLSAEMTIKILVERLNTLEHTCYCRQTVSTLCPKEIERNQ